MKHPNIDLSPVDSSQIHAIGHDSATNTLAVQFKSRGEPGNVYHYANVNAEQFSEFRDAESIGTHFGQHIKKKADAHPYIKIDQRKKPDHE